MKEFKFKDVLINEKTTIKESMKKLDEVASKILFVLSDDNHLIGSLTDGDIRRFILSNNTLDSKVSEVCNKNCFKIIEPFDRDEVLSDMEKLDIIYAPVLNNNGIIFDVFTLPLSNRRVVKYSQIKLDIPVVIMAGGKGSRMEPFTKVLPKPLIPIGDETILEHIINEFRKYNINEYYFTLNFKAEMIMAYFNSIEKDYEIQYIIEKDFFGTGGSLNLLKNKINGDFIVSNCDIIVKADYSDVYRFHKNNESYLTVVSSIQHQKFPYGVIEFSEGGKIISLIEKPEFTFPINTGIYILNKKCFDYIPENEFFHMTELIEKLIDNGKPVYTYPVNEGDFIDIGQWEEYRKATDRLSW